MLSKSLELVRSQKDLICTVTLKLQCYQQVAHTAGSSVSFQRPTCGEILLRCHLAWSLGSVPDANHYCFLLDSVCMMLSRVFLNVTELVKRRPVPLRLPSGISRLSALILVPCAK